MDNKYIDFIVSIYGKTPIIKEIDYVINKRLIDLCRDNYDEFISLTSYIKLTATDNSKYIGKNREWVFKIELSNKTLYKIIEDQIKNESNNNIYTEEDKYYLKIFIEEYGKRTKEEIADIFNENINNQTEIINTQVIEEKAIIKPYENLQCGLIMPESGESVMYLQGYEQYDIENIVKEMYTSAAINGTVGEVSKKKYYFYDNHILPFNNIKDNLLSDFNNYEPYSNYIYQTYDLRFIIICIYETFFTKKYHNYMKDNFIRYLVPIIVNDNKEETVLEAVLEYFNNISGRVSNEYQRRIEAFQKKYRK